ncbi:MAG: response regulator transcription factor [Myxococcales bacterium FL481]|nr:MAG: response regulator transcription factor [Myxococcales bacterium FL481]
MADAAACRVLVVEDEENLARGLKLNFELEGYEVDVAASGRSARDFAAAHDYDAIILDVMLPDDDGFAVCQGLRHRGDTTPVLMLTACGTTDERVRGLEAGADDYMVKPFELAELLARVRSMLRRRDWEQSLRDHEPPAVFAFGRARIDFTLHEASVGDIEVKLTALEFALLRYFADNPRRVLSRNELQSEVWKLDNYPNSRMVDNFVMRLRKHFEPNPSQPRYFLSVRGLGYKFEPDRVAEPSAEASP